MNRNDNSESILSELDDVSFAAHRIHSITWAADQLLTENNDKTLTEAQFRERVSFLLDAAMNGLQVMRDDIEALRNRVQENCGLAHRLHIQPEGLACRSG